jgi:hypothetical protein
MGNAYKNLIEYGRRRKDSEFKNEKIIFKEERRKTEYLQKLTISSS